MHKFVLGLLVPAAIILAAAWWIPSLELPPSISGGIRLGLVVAVAQSLLSIAALRWSWNRPIFYWVWGGGLALRVLVFSATAYAVVKSTTLSLAATLVSLVIATTA